MRKCLLGLLLLSGSLAAQVIVKDHNSGAIVTTPLVLPDVAVDDLEQETLDVVNTGGAAVTIQSATVTGLYYSLCCESGFVLQPGASQSLTLQFAPLATGYFSGALQIDSTAIFVFGSSIAAPSVFVQAPSGSVQAHSGTPLVLTLDASFSGHLPCTLQNPTSGPMTVTALSASGGWVLTNAPALPILIPGGQQVSFTLSRAAAASNSPVGTTIAGILMVGQWSYAIDAHPPSPGIHIQLPSSPLQSGQQVPLTISFDSPPTDSTAGTVTLTLNTNAAVALTDPAILFPSTGTVTAAFSSVSGQTAASFEGKSSVQFQTGTTAGTLHIHASWEYSADDVTIALAPSPVVIESLAATKSGSSLNLTLTGYDNTRSVGPLSFSFYNSQGGFIGNTVTVDDSKAFYKFFFQTDSAAGGMFQMTAQFPVTGGTGQIAAVRVGLMNSAGDAQSSITQFH